MLTRKFALTSVCLVAGIALCLCGCIPVDPGGTNQNGSVKGTGRLKPFSSPDDLIQYFRQQVSASMNNNGGLRGDGIAEDFVGAPTLAGGNPTPNQAEGAGDAASGVQFTSTNVQEEGVDEADYVKTDGRYLYVARGTTLRITDTKTADGSAEDLRPIGEIDLTLPISGIYLNGDAVIALVQDWGYGWATPALAFPAIDIWPPYYARATLKLIQISVADRSNPTIVAQSEFDGSLVSSRLTGGRLFLVLTITPNLPGNVTPLGLQQITLNQIQPQFRRDGQASDLVAWEDWLRPEDPNGFNMIAVVTLDAADVKNKLQSAGLLGNAYTIYASTTALYVTDTIYEEENNIQNEITTVHKFSLGESGAVYAASGTVVGRPLNQFSLGEFNNDLRIATQVQPLQVFRNDDVVGIGIFPGLAGGTSGNSGSGVTVDPAQPAPANAQAIAPSGPSTAVYVMRQNGPSLDTIGKIENIKPGERMYAARFIGPRGFLVTFRQIDPLFVLDMADPASPRIAGELEVPGFSEYLHLLDQDHLLGIGTSTTQSPWGATIADGIQISLFDVTDSANPTAVQQLTIGEAWSKADASYDHHAFALFQHNGVNILALPSLVVDTADQNRWQPIAEFNGVLAFNVDAQTGFTDRGRLEAVVEQGYWGGWNEWRRVVIIGERLFAVSSAGIQAGALSDLSATGRVEFPPLYQDVPSGWTEAAPPPDVFVGRPIGGF